MWQLWLRNQGVGRRSIGGKKSRLAANQRKSGKKLWAGARSDLNKSTTHLSYYLSPVTLFVTSYLNINRPQLEEDSPVKVNLFATFRLNFVTLSHFLHFLAFEIDTSSQYSPDPFILRFIFLNVTLSQQTEFFCFPSPPFINIQKLKSRIYPQPM